jgi:hypothetical protein
MSGMDEVVLKSEEDASDASRLVSAGHVMLDQFEN